jgi:hypothetical protein
MPEMIVIEKDELGLLIKKAIKESQKPVKHPVEWITPKQARELLKVKSPITLNRIIREHGIQTRYRTTTPEIFLQDILNYIERQKKVTG